MTFGYDLAGEKTSIAYPGTTALTVNYAYLTTGELSSIKQATTSLATYAYDNLGNRAGVTFGNGASQSFSYDPVSRLSQLTNSLTDTNDLTATFSYDPASWIRSTTRTGDAYAWTGHGNGSTAYVANGLNEQTTIGGVAAAYDARGNLTAEPQSGKTYGYSSENLLTSASGGVTLAYDPAMRLYQTVGASTTRFLYDGADPIAEYNASNALQRRFVFDPTTDQPVIWYEGTGTAASNRRYLSTDERGSVISVSDSTGAALGINTYDEYGKPGASNTGRFQYTGQMWVPEVGAYYYKARFYDAKGRFLQTDPIGNNGDGPNLYAYVLNDPVNFIDPTGLSTNVHTCTGSRVATDKPCSDVSIFASQLPILGGVSGGGGGGASDVSSCESSDTEIIVCGQAPTSNFSLDAFENALLPVQIAGNDLPDLTGPGLAIFFKNQFKGGLQQLRNRHQCAVSNISGSKVAGAAGESGMHKVVSGLALDVIGGLLTDGFTDLLALGETALSVTEESATEATAGAAASAAGQACSG